MWRTIVGAMVLVAIVGCYEDGDMEPQDTAPWGEDAGEGEGEGEGQTEKETECPTNSGYPCACNGPTCDNGESCLLLGEPDEPGLCARSCTEFGSPDFACAAEFGVAISGVVAGGICAVQQAGVSYCLILCEFQGAVNGTCPEGTKCSPVDGTNASVCLPHATQ